LTNQITHTFRKEEKLCSQKMMGELFLSGNSFLSYPLRVTWKVFSNPLFQSPAQAGFSVPKRIFRRSVDRNRLKRLMRESYRIHKSDLYEKLQSADTQLVLMLIYIGKEELPFTKIDQAITKSIVKINGQLTGVNCP
jgi:ribonuclease P protein component